MNRWERLGLAAAVFLALAALVMGVGQEPQGVSVMGVTNLDSLTLRDNLIVGKASTLGSGGLAVTGNLSLSNGSLINTKGAVTVTDQLQVSSQIAGLNGLTVAGNITSTDDLVMSTGAIVDATGAVTVNDQLYVASQIVAANGVDVTGNITVGASNDLVMHGGNIWDDTNDVDVMDDMEIAGKLVVGSQITASNGVAVTGNVTVSTDLDVAGNAFSTSGSFRINDAAIITGDLTIVGGNIADDGGSVRINDNTLITGTLNVTGMATFNSASRFDSQLNTANGLDAAGGITSTGLLTVTNWGLFYGAVLTPQVGQVVTANYGITPTSYSVIHVADDGGQATGEITLDGTTSIVDGTYAGQILVVIWTDTDGASLEFPDNSNVQFAAAGSLKLGPLEGAMFMWFGTDWVYLGGGTVS